jgi:hypothetical protein
MLGLDPHKETIMENKKKTWIRPQLIVLGRGQPEENVLVACKARGGAGTPVGPGELSRCSIDGQVCKIDVDT